MRSAPAKPRNEPMFKLGTCKLKMVDKYSFLCINLPKPHLSRFCTFVGLKRAINRAKTMFRTKLTYVDYFWFVFFPSGSLEPHDLLRL